MEVSQKRESCSRSVSSDTFSSVSTISTNQSDGRRHESPRTKTMSGIRRGPPSRSPKRHRKRRRRSSSVASSMDRDGPRARKISTDRDKNMRRRFGSHSPEERGRRKGRSVERNHRMHSTSSTSSMEVYSRRDPSLSRDKRDKVMEDPGRRQVSSGRGVRHETDLKRRQSPPRRENRNFAPAPPRERSLSPYSKRLALTQAMNMGNG